jgi:hypothetical protein
MYLESMGSAALGARMTVGSIPEMMPVPRKRSQRVLVKDLLAWKRIEPDWVSETVRRHYLSSWFLVHYLVNKNTAGFYELFRRLGRAEDPRAAWKGAFPQWDPDVPDALDDLEAKLDTYGRGESFQYHEIEPKVSPTVKSRPLPPSEVHAYRALLLPHGGARSPEVLRAEVDEALAEDPADPLAIAVLAGLDPKRDVLPMARASVKAHPSDWRAWSLLGDALARGPREEFLAARRKAVEVGPSEPVALQELARDLSASGEAREASGPALALLKLAPWSPTTHETVAQVAMSLGLCADALRAQQRAIDTISDRASPEMRIEKEKTLATYVQRCAAPAAPPGPAVP